MAYGQQQVILITGAASGLGWALTQQYLALGHFVVMADIQNELLQTRAAELDEHKVMAVCMDITQQEDIQQLIKALQEKYGRLDTLINNAGITHRSLIEQTQPKVFRQVMAVDYHGPVELALAALPLLKESKGLIINVSSMAGWMPVLGRAGYCAAKSALHQFFEVMRCEVKQYGVNILMVYPSFLDTPIEVNALGGDGQRATHKRSLVGKMATAQDVANTIISGHQNNKARIFPDRFTWFASIAYKLVPSVFLKSMSRQFASELQQAK
jgi:NAD(P)-dependent dehydrogenase (short-subunit alcohol dehydrogenase family)